jgi:ABC-type nitrate/sulfonate/bicarbonate transport system substrate-binding protein
MHMHQLTRKHALTLAGAGALSALTPSLARGQTATIRVGQNAADTFGEGYYAADRGAFAAAGLDVVVSTFTNGAAQAEACAGGAIDVGLGEATELANGISRGLPFAVFASGSLYDSAAPTTQFCVAANSQFHTAKDIEGQTIAVPALTSLSSMAVRAWLVKGGADLSKTHFIELPLGAIIPAILRGTVAGGHVGEPYLSAGGNTVRRIASPYDSVAKKFVISDWFATRAWLIANQSIAKRLSDVIYDTARWANAHHDESAPILAKYTKIDIDVIRKMVRVGYATSFQPQLMQPVLDTAFSYGGLTRHVEASELSAAPKA